ncbi:MAG: YebC/PmpR family DNA-binding transcriptional regulator [Candidatus Atribacteria bacterium]|nr:YebC/PmpR family DNA-binding transcriptional regulator [Candidatus Atribacteria bacterium]MBE3093176.1 YebC/PmpR family DNA-binding transcriptional regulator [Chloroflexota bacterium]
MSGHSKWSTIKRKKGKADAQRGKIFTKIIRVITVAARSGGGDPETNVKLKVAIQSAKENNMPNENIEKAIKRGTGEADGVSYEEIIYEGYGPGGVAVLIEALTDNKNRTTPEVRKIFSKNAGNLGENGCVAWMFDKRGYFIFEIAKVNEDIIVDLALEAEAEDVKSDSENIEVMTPPENYKKFSNLIKEQNIDCLLSEVTLIPKTTVDLEGKKARQMLNLMEQLEDQDDVQKVYANFNIADEIMEEISASKDKS